MSEPICIFSKLRLLNYQFLCDIVVRWHGQLMLWNFLFVTIYRWSWPYQVWSSPLRWYIHLCSTLWVLVEAKPLGRADILCMNLTSFLVCFTIMYLKPKWIGVIILLCLKLVWLISSPGPASTPINSNVDCNTTNLKHMIGPLLNPALSAYQQTAGFEGEYLNSW